jgi:hypothetical protein
MKRLAGHLAMVLGAILASLLVLEAVCIVGYWIHDGAYLSVREELDRQSSQFIHSRSDCLYVNEVFPHPYLGYVFNRNPPCGDDSVNSMGTFGREFPAARLPDKFVILLTGGSAASQLFQISHGSFEEQLNRSYSIPGKEFLVLDGAVDAWKQPQQLIMFALNSSILDGVITLDGFNEFEIPQSARSRFEMPWKESVLATNPLYDPANRQVLDLASASNTLYQLSHDHWLLSHSKLAYLVLSRMRNVYRERAHDVVAHSPVPAMTLDTLFGAGTQPDDERASKRSFEQYARYMRTMDAIAAKFDIRIAHFLQPVATYGKPLSPQEKELIGGEDGRAYHDFVTPLLELRKEGIAIFSLLDLYAGRKETLYIDRVHQNMDAPGYPLMAKEMARLVGEAWHLPRRPEPRP